MPTFRARKMGQPKASLGIEGRASARVWNGDFALIEGRLATPHIWMVQ